MNIWLKTAVISLVVLVWSLIMTGLVAKGAGKKKATFYAAAFLISLHTLAMSLVIFVVKL